MTISVNVQLPIADKQMGVQITMPVEDAVSILGEIGQLASTGPMLALLKDALTSHLNP